MFPCFPGNTRERGVVRVRVIVPLTVRWPLDELELNIVHVQTFRGAEYELVNVGGYLDHRLRLGNYQVGFLPATEYDQLAPATELA